MNRTSIKKSIIFFILMILLMITLAPAVNSTIIKNTNIRKGTFKKSFPTSAENNWYWKESYPNYSPSGMPDFDQRQERWKSIKDGGDGIVDTNSIGDDVQIEPYGSYIEPGTIIIASGKNCQLESIPGGDDFAFWAFSGPAALANCFWWFDSRFANPDGIPGDGVDEYSIVQSYGVDDDHSPDNVPLLIENLAKAMNTTVAGTTYVDEMANSIDQWLNDTDLRDRYKNTIKSEPTFDYIFNEINQSKNIILLLGLYDYIIGDKKEDQIQPASPFIKLLQTSPWWDYQSFTPQADRIDSISIPLQSITTDVCEIQINVYDEEEGDPIGTVNMNPGYLENPTWITFQFDPFIELIPNEIFFFDVSQSENGYHYQWFFSSPDPYFPGKGWMDKVPLDPYGFPFDWAFITSYFDPPPTSIRRDSHYVTCSGVNYDEKLIAFSDPTINIVNISGNDHNDAMNVSHDIYMVNTSCPCPDLNFPIWLLNYQTDYNYY